jgi:hypothetical protein
MSLSGGVNGKLRICVVIPELCRNTGTLSACIFHFLLRL